MVDGSLKQKQPVTFTFHGFQCLSLGLLFYFQPQWLTCSTLPNRNAAHGEEEGEEDAEEVSRWNMRKCSAAGLDVLSTVFQEELLPIVTPIVQQRLQEEDWRARESAILALGAIAEGCVMGLIPYLPQLVSMLLPRLEDPRPLVRSAFFHMWHLADPPPLFLFKVLALRIKDVSPEVLARFGCCTRLDSTIHSIVAPAVWIHILPYFLRQEEGWRV